MKPKLEIGLLSIKIYPFFKFKVDDVLRFQDSNVAYVVKHIRPATLFEESTSSKMIRLEYVKDGMTHFTSVLAFCDGDSFQHFYEAWDFY